MISKIYKDFDKFLTELALAVEQQYTFRKDVKVTVDNDRTEDDSTGTLLAMNIEDIDEELIVEYDMTDIDEEPSGISTLGIICSCGEKHYSTGVDRYNETYEYDEETGEEFQATEADMPNATYVKGAVLKFIEDVINE